MSSHISYKPVVAAVLSGVRIQMSSQLATQIDNVPVRVAYVPKRFLIVRSLRREPGFRTYGRTSGLDGMLMLLLIITGLANNMNLPGANRSGYI